MQSYNCGEFDYYYFGTDPISIHIILCDISRAIYLADFNQICKDITFGHDEVLITIGDLDQNFKVTVAHKQPNRYVSLYDYRFKVG